jgi:hypothetical protein
MESREMKLISMCLSLRDLKKSMISYIIEVQSLKKSNFLKGTISQIFRMIHLLLK